MKKDKGRINDGRRRTNKRWRLRKRRRNGSRKRG
jgi:hypothetical protein